MGGVGHAGPHLLQPHTAFFHSVFVCKEDRGGKYIQLDAEGRGPVIAEAHYVT